MPADCKNLSGMIHRFFLSPAHAASRPLFPSLDPCLVLQSWLCLTLRFHPGVNYQTAFEPLLESGITILPVCFLCIACVILVILAASVGTATVLILDRSSKVTERKSHFCGLVWYGLIYHRCFEVKRISRACVR